MCYTKAIRLIVGIGIMIPGVALAGQEPSSLAGPTINIRRAAGAIVLDGDLSDPGWEDAVRIDTWYETSPGDNTVPRVRNVGYLTYDDEALYAGFEFSDPDPSQIRAPLNDRDNLSFFTDYAGMYLDSMGDGRTATMFIVNANGMQYDAVKDDVTGKEDASPDYFWESATRITEEGWFLEMRIPFSSVRYRNTDPPRWSILLYRSYPRDFAYRINSARRPRGSNCTVCRANRLEGLERLPVGGNIVLAPYASAASTARPVGGLGTPLASGSLAPQGGLDVKWTPNSTTAFDLTVNPDFSQVEGDTAQITANERFALNFPEKRPFFLEGVQLFSSPIQAAYTRTITAPRWGVRATGKLGQTSYTLLVADDEGGGSLVVPGPNSSTLVPQDLASVSAIARLQRDVGRSFVSLIATTRETEDGSHNRVVGPDFQWRPSSSDAITGQILVSDSAYAPQASRPGSGPLSGYAADVEFERTTRTVNFLVKYRDVDRDFRADNGFVPQVGIRQGTADAGYTWRPDGVVSRVKTLVFSNYTTEIDGGLVNQQVGPGIELDGLWSSQGTLRYSVERVRAVGSLLTRRQGIYTFRINPSRRIANITVNGTFGEEVDFAHARLGRGLTTSIIATLNPTTRFQVQINRDHRKLDVTPDRPGPNDGAVDRGRLFTAAVSRVRGTYAFTPRMFVRAIGQYVSTDRNPDLYLAPVVARSGTFAGSLLVAYRWNWQTVVFLGYADNRTLTELDRLERSDRQIFAKVSYAFRR